MRTINSSTVVIRLFLTVSDADLTNASPWRFTWGSVVQGFYGRAASKSFWHPGTYVLQMANFPVCSESLRIILLYYNSEFTVRAFTIKVPTISLLFFTFYLSQTFSKWVSNDLIAHISCRRHYPSSSSVKRCSTKDLMKKVFKGNERLKYCFFLSLKLWVNVTFSKLFFQRQM